MGTLVLDCVFDLVFLGGGGGKLFPGGGTCTICDVGVVVDGIEGKGSCGCDVEL